jgi:hypothetical protein
MRRSRIVAIASSAVADSGTEMAALGSSFSIRSS